MKSEQQKFKEQSTIKDFVALCVPSMEPDSYTFLVEKLIPFLRDARGLLDYDLVDEYDGKLHLHDTDGNKVRLLTDGECADYIWGKDPKRELTPLEQCLLDSLHMIKDTATSYDSVYHEHEMPAGCISSDSLFIVLAEIRKHFDKLGVK